MSEDEKKPSLDIPESEMQDNNQGQDDATLAAVGTLMQQYLTPTLTNFDIRLKTIADTFSVKLNNLETAMNEKLCSLQQQLEMPYTQEKRTGESSTMIADTKVPVNHHDTSGDTKSTVNRLITKKIEDLPTFGGTTNENTVDWLDQVNDACERARMSEKEKIITAELELKGDVAKWFRANQDELKDWAMFRIKMTGRFALGQTNKHSIGLRLHSRKQQINETSSHYITAMEDLCLKYNPTMSLFDQVLFMRAGVRDELLEFVSLRDPQTPDELLSAMNTWDEIDLQKQQRMTGSNLDETRIGCVNLGQARQVEADGRWSHTQQRHEREPMMPRQPTIPRQNQRDWRTHNAVGNQQRQNSNGDYSSSYRANGRRTGCYNCGDPSHHEKFCPN
jgi:hypothetical protein